MNYVILAGGSGTRLWPMSRALQPKQLASLVSDVTMIEDTVNRLSGIAESSQIYISTNAAFAPLIQELMPQIPVDHYIIEPAKRDTGPAMAFVATWLSLIAPDEPMMLMSSDHLIRDTKAFQETLLAAEEIIREQGTMVNFGITPNFPNISLGYLKIGPKLNEQRGIQVYEFGGQKEKPDHDTAKQFLNEGNYLWNAGYFAWTPAKFMAAYKQFAPGIGNHLDALSSAIRDKNSSQLAATYDQMEAKSIDYVLIEKMDPATVRTVRGDFGWADLGSWDTLFEELGDKADEQGNLIKANWQGIDTKNTLVYAPEGKLVTTIGVNNLVIVDTPDALLITPMDRAQDVKKIVDLLKQQNLHHHL
jgi:mannose-1-phosphate guanylyltransferase